MREWPEPKKKPCKLRIVIGKDYESLAERRRDRLNIYYQLRNVIGLRLRKHFWSEDEISK